MAQEDTLQKMDPMDIMNLAQKAGQTVASNKETHLKIEKIMDSQTSLIQEQKGNIDNIAVADSTITAEKNRYLAETDVKKAAAQAAFSSDFAQQGSKSNELAAEIITNYSKANIALDAIHAKEKVGLMDNPLDYIMNKFTLPADNAEYNYYVRKHNNAENTLNALMDGTEKAANIANKMQRSTSADMAAAENDRILQTAAFNKNKLTIDNAGFRINGLSTLQSLDAQELDIASKLLSATNADEHLKLAQRHEVMMKQDMALKQQSLALQIADRSDRMADRRDQLNAATQTMNEYNVGARQSGGMEFNDPKRFMQMLPTLSKDPDAVSKMVAGQKLLYNQANNIDSVVPVAPSVGAAARIYAKGNAQGNEVGTMLASVYTSLEGRPELKNPEVLEAEVTKQAKIKATQQAQVIDVNSPNIYDAPSTGIMLKAKIEGITEILSAPVFRDTVVPMLNANPKLDLNYMQMISKANEYVLANPGELNSTADAMSKYYGAAKSVNNTIKQYQANLLDNQTSFRARVKLPYLSLGTGAILNLDDVNSWKRILMSGAAAQRGSAYSTDFLN